jgi:putative inorganic carbon (HCO3(-)) transporter
VRRIVETGLYIAIWTAVLAFGGASPPFFFPTQFIILGLGVLILSASLRTPGDDNHFPILIPFSLIALVLLQIFPIPVFLGLRSSAPRSALGWQRGNTLSIAPYQTVSALLLLITYVTTFYLVLWVCERREAKKRIVYVLLALGAFEAFYGLVQYLTGWQQIFLYVKKYYVQDATGTYINRNHFAGFLEMALPFAITTGLRRASALRRGVQRSETKARSLLSSPELLPLAGLLFLAIAIFAGLVFSRSRMGILSSVVSIAVVLVLAGSSSTSKGIGAVVAALFFLGVMGIVVWVGTDPVMNRFEILGQEYSQAGQNRISIWRDTLGLVRQHPLLGTGLGTFSVAYTSVQTVFLTQLVDHAHCDYLEVASELGLPGAMLLFGSIFWILARAVRRYRKSEDNFDSVVWLGCIGSIAAILLHSLADFNLYIPANAVVLAVTLALAWM